MNFEKKNVFISYRTQSGWELANLIQNYLSSRNISVFFDKEDIKGGQKWQAVLQENIKKCSVFIPVLYGDSHQYKVTENDQKEQNDWLWWEIDLALSTPGVHVIPIRASNFVAPTNLPDKFKKLFNDSIGGSNGLIEVNQDTVLLKLNKLYKDIRRYIPSNSRFDTDLYSNEKAKKSSLDEALKENNKEAESTFVFDYKIINSITNEFDELYVLDLGCGDGFKSRNLFARSQYKLRKLIGIDIKQEFIDKAIDITKEHNDHFEYYQHDLRDHDSKNFIESIMDKSLPDNQKFNVIYISMLLLHLAEPYRIIEMAKSLLSKDGVLIITDIDDSFNLYYPDENGWIEEFNRLCNESHNNGNRLTGRQIYTFLVNAGFSREDIKIRNVLIPRAKDFTFDQRVEDFEKKYNQLLAEFEEKNKKQYELFYYEAINWLKTCKEDIKKAFGDVQFNTQSHLIICAKN